MFNFFKKKIKLNESIKEIEEGLIKNQPKEVIRVGLESYEVPARPVLTEKGKNQY